MKKNNCHGPYLGFGLMGILQNSRLNTNDKSFGNIDQIACIYLNPYINAFVPALIFVNSVGITPKIGDSPLDSKNITHILMMAYGVQAKNHTRSTPHAILASFTSISIYNMSNNYSLDWKLYYEMVILNIPFYLECAFFYTYPSMKNGPCFTIYHMLGSTSMAVW